MFLDFESIVDQLPESFIDWIKEKCEKQDFFLSFQLRTLFRMRFSLLAENFWIIFLKHTLERISPIEYDSQSELKCLLSKLLFMNHEANLMQGTV